MPPLLILSSQPAWNQSVRGTRVPSKMVPAVRETGEVQTGQRQMRPLTLRGATFVPQPSREQVSSSPPAQPVQIVEAVLVSLEPRAELALGAWVVFSSFCHRKVGYLLTVTWRPPFFQNSMKKVSLPT